MIYAFGEFELDEDRFQLRWRSEPLDLEPKIFEVLAYLISNRDRVVPKQELLDTLWHNQIVGDWSLTRTISVARKTLEDAGARVDVAPFRLVHEHGFARERRFVHAGVSSDDHAVHGDDFTRVHAH